MHLHMFILDIAEVSYCEGIKITSTTKLLLLDMKLRCKHHCTEPWQHRGNTPLSRLQLNERLESDNSFVNAFQRPESNTFRNRNLPQGNAFPRVTCRLQH